jgi:amino acid transporter
MVTLLQATGLGGYGVFTALAIAVVLSLTYVVSFAELALMFPSAGSLSVYTKVALGDFPALAATFSGYVIPAMFGLSAELLLIGNIGDRLVPGLLPPIAIAWLLLGVFAVLNILGIDLFARIQNALTVVKVLAILTIGLGAIALSAIQTSTPPVVALPDQTNNIGFLGLVTLVMMTFLGVEMICPLVEETKAPEKDLPRAMIISVFVIGGLSAIFCLGAKLTMPAEQLSTSPAPHLDYVVRVFGRAATLILAAAIVTATCGVVNGVLATVPRILYGMACNGQAFGTFKRLHPRFRTPWVAILFMTLVAGLPLIVLHDRADMLTILLISTSVPWLLAYIIAHVDVLALRRRLPNKRRPFKTPFYPIPQIIGIAGMGCAVVYNAPTPELSRAVYASVGVVILATCLASALWVKFVMKRGLFEADAFDPATLSDPTNALTGK